jgi:hypothetical protein
VVEEGEFSSGVFPQINFQEGVIETQGMNGFLALDYFIKFGF